MSSDNVDASLDTLREIRSIMDRSARFLSLSGWSGIWAGCTAIAGAAIAYGWMGDVHLRYTGSLHYIDASLWRFLGLAAVVFIVALLGGFFFTYRKATRMGQKIWNSTSRMMLLQMAIPLIAGGFFCISFLHYGQSIHIAPTCLVFYGLALVSTSRYTISDIRFLGMLEVALGCISMFVPGNGLVFWVIGFGLLHILYGIIMWNKYDKKTTAE